MNLIQLKTAILENNIPQDLLIFICKDPQDKSKKQDDNAIANAKYLALTYTREIAKQRGLTIRFVDTLSSCTLSTTQKLFDFDSDSFSLNVLLVDNFEEKFSDYTAFNNTIIICNTVSKNILPMVSLYSVQFFSPSPIILFSYIRSNWRGIDLTPNGSNILKLLEVTDGNLFRIEQELNKTLLFAEEERSHIFDLMLNSPNTTLSAKTFDVWKFSDAILDKNRLKVFSDMGYLKKSGKFDAIGLSTILINKITNILMALSCSTNNPEQDLGMSAKQYYFLRRSNRYSRTFLEKKLKFLSNIDLELKQSKLSLTPFDLLTYIVSNMLS